MKPIEVRIENKTDGNRLFIGYIDHFGKLTSWNGIYAFSLNRFYSNVRLREAAEKRIKEISERLGL